MHRNTPYSYFAQRENATYFMICFVYNIYFKEKKTKCYSK